MVAVAIHGAFRAPEDLFLEEQETIGSGLFNFFNQKTASKAAVIISAYPTCTSKSNNSVFIHCKR